MNIDTGEIIRLNEAGETLDEAFGDNDEIMEFDPSLATDKQRRKMQVSLHDTRSKLGKLRRARKIQRKRRKANR